MKSDEIRNRFLKFFEARGHKVVPSDSLVPTKDPSILFTGAGMNQFKEQFMGRNVTYKRAATSQKCLRTADLENVGRTASHHTFFEMLGNFSFGDYFKKEAIAWAWEFLTVDLRIPKEKLSVSIYEEDQEAYNIWLNDIKVPPQKILKMGDKDNFWPAEAKKYGPNGPCGPCSEIFYDRGKGEPTELWNLVFTQFERKEGGLLENLPGKNIDTGMGLERLASVMQGVDTNFEIDIFVPIIQAIKRELNLEPGTQNPEPHINAIADHIRAVTFSIADGVYPSNEERGFVIRKLVRKAVQRALQIKPGCGPFLYRIVPAVAKAMKAAYPELEPKRESISQIVKSEEERFQNIVLEIVPLLKEEFAELKNKGVKKIPGEIIFRYSDEKGVPMDFQKELAEGLGIELDMDNFNKFLEEQKERSRGKSKISKEIFAGASGLARKKEEEWDEASKQKIRMNHTATHLLHAALRKVLGEHARQSGSLVYPERLRFDFTNPKRLEGAQILRVEALVNEQISRGIKVERAVMKLDEAKRQGAIALFGEKYGEDVVVRTIGDFSKELCSGDHVSNIGEIRIFKIIQDSSIAAGTRRIEAVTGDAVYLWLTEQAKKARDSISELLKKAPAKNDIRDPINSKLREIDGWLAKKNAANLAYQDLKKWADYEEDIAKLAGQLEECIKESEKQRGREKDSALLSIKDEIIKTAKEVNGIKIISYEVWDADIGALRKLTDNILSSEPAAVILLAGSQGDKVNLTLAVGKAASGKGLDAKELIKPIAACVGGSGGGRPDMAQAGGKDVSKIKEALGLIYNLIKEMT